MGKHELVQQRVAQGTLPGSTMLALGKCRSQIGCCDQDHSWFRKGDLVTHEKEETVVRFSKGMKVGLLEKALCPNLTSLNLSRRIGQIVNTAI